MQDSPWPPGPALEGPRAARPGEVPAVVDLVNQVFCVALGKPPTMGEQFPHFLSPENADNLFIFTDQGRPVSHAGLWMGAIHLPGVRLPIACMGSVCTLPEARSRGLADRLVQLALDRVRAQGRPLLFISGERSLYRRNGAHPAGRFRPLQLARTGAPTGAGPRDPRVALRGARFPEEASLLAALYQQEPVRWHRALADWSMLAEAAAFATILGLRQEIWLVEAAGEPAACWVTGASTSPPGEVLVLEHFGSRSVLAASLQQLFEATGAERVRLPLLEGDPLIHDLAGAGWPAAGAPLEALPGTVAIPDWPLFWKLLGPYLEERLPESWAAARAWVQDGGQAAGPRRYGLETAGGERWEVEGEEALIRALFGAGATPATELIPSGHPLGRALPIPLPWPQGLNYI